MKKVTDGRKAKARLWTMSAQNGLPALMLPAFPPQKFRTHIEMNQWKAALLRKAARLSKS
jgi:hypothetical protein